MIISSFIGINVLNEKSEIGQVFLTDEQKTKVYFYNLFMLSLILGTLSALIYLMIHLDMSNDKSVFNSEELSLAVALAIGVFLFCIISLGRLAKLVNNFFVKYHYKFKVNLPGIGDAYILRMLNTEVCICSKNPSSEFKVSSKKYYLVSVNSIMERPLSKIKLRKPKQSVFQKLFN